MVDFLFSRPSGRKGWRFGPELGDIWLLQSSQKPTDSVKNELLALVDRMHSQETLEQGKAAFLEGQNEYAVSLFSAAIALERKGGAGTLPELYSNRSSAFLALKMVDEAVSDAQTYLDIRSETWELLQAEQTRQAQQANPRARGICSCWRQDTGEQAAAGVADSGNEQHEQSAMVRQRVRQAVKRLHRDFFADREIQLISKNFCAFVRVLLVVTVLGIFAVVTVHVIAEKEAYRASQKLGSHGTIRGAHLNQIMRGEVPGGS